MNRKPRKTNIYWGYADVVSGVQLSKIVMGVKIC